MLFFYTINLLIHFNVVSKTNTIYQFMYKNRILNIRKLKLFNIKNELNFLKN